MRTAASAGSMRCAIRRATGSSRPMPWARRARIGRRRRSGGDGAAFPSCRRGPHRPREADRAPLQRQTPWRRTRATRSPRRCSPTASTSSAAPSSIIARAASSATASRSRMRCCRSIGAGAAPIRTTGRPSIEAVDGLSRALAEPLAVARASMSARSTMCCRRCSSPASTTRPSCGRGPSGTGSMSRGSAPRRVSAGRPARPIRTATSTRHAHCDVLVVGAGPAGLAAALAASRERQAGHARRRAGGDGRRSAARRRPPASTARPAWDWLADTLAALSARENVVVLPRTTAFGYYNHNHIGLVQRLTDHLPQPHPDLPRERLWQVRAARGGAGDGRARATARLRRQRPARHHAGREPARVRQPLRRGAGTPGRHRDIRRFRLYGGCGPEEGRARRDPRRSAPGKRLRLGGRCLAGERLRGADRAYAFSDRAGESASRA